MKDWHSYSHERQGDATLWLAGLGLLCAWALGGIMAVLRWTPPWWFDTPAPLGFCALLYKIYDGGLWRSGFLRKLHRIPDLNGRYQVTIRTSHDGHASTLEGKAVISQSWSHIVVRLQTNSSESKSQGGWLVEAPGLGFCLTYVYGNKPKSAAASTMHPHDGTAVVTFDEARRGTGIYYTGRDRMNYGELTFEPEVPSPRAAEEKQGV